MLYSCGQMNFGIQNFRGIGKVIRCTYGVWGSTHMGFGAVHIWGLGQYTVIKHITINAAICMNVHIKWDIWRLKTVPWAGYLSRYSDCLRTGRSGIEFRWGRDFSSVQTGSEAHPASYTIGNESFPGVEAAGVWGWPPPRSSAEGPGKD